MDFGLAGKTAIVTGGASNIGHGIVMAFAKEGTNVVIADIDEAQARFAPCDQIRWNLACQQAQSRLFLCRQKRT